MYKIQVDGNQWFATGVNFKNLQESDAGFGDTPMIALHELIATEEKRKLDLLTVPDCFERAQHQGRYFDNCVYFKECKKRKPICMNSPMS